VRAPARWRMVRVFYWRLRRRPRRLRRRLRWLRRWLNRTTNDHQQEITIIRQESKGRGVTLRPFLMPLFTRVRGSPVLRSSAQPRPTPVRLERTQRVFSRQPSRLLWATQCSATKVPDRSAETLSKRFLNAGSQECVWPLGHKRRQPY
jgi:hypothetical protein